MPFSVILGEMVFPGQDRLTHLDGFKRSMVILGTDRCRGRARVKELHHKRASELLWSTRFANEIVVQHRNSNQVSHLKSRSGACRDWEEHYYVDQQNSTGGAYSIRSHFD